MYSGGVSCVDLVNYLGVIHIPLFFMVIGSGIGYVNYWGVIHIPLFFMVIGSGIGYVDYWGVIHITLILLVICVLVFEFSTEV